MRFTNVVSGLVILSTSLAIAAPADVNAVAVVNAKASEANIVARNDDDRKKWEKEQREREKKEREKWEKENKHRGSDDDRRKWEKEQREREKKERERWEKEQREREKHRGNNGCSGCGYNNGPPPPGYGYNSPPHSHGGNAPKPYPGYGPYEPDPRRDGPYHSPDILPYQYCDNLRRAYYDCQGDIRRIAQALNVAENVAREYVNEAKNNRRRNPDKDERWFNSQRKCYL